jgi:hypothetical protein
MGMQNEPVKGSCHLYGPRCGSEEFYDNYSCILNYYRNVGLFMLCEVGSKFLNGILIYLFFSAI